MQGARVAAPAAACLLALFLGGCGGDTVGDAASRTETAQQDRGDGSAETDAALPSGAIPGMGVATLITTCTELDYVINGPDADKFADPAYLYGALAATGPEALRDDFRTLRTAVDAYARTTSGDDSLGDRVAKLAEAWGPEATEADARIGAWAAANC